MLQRLSVFIFWVIMALVYGYTEMIKFPFQGSKTPPNLQPQSTQKLPRTTKTGFRREDRKMERLDTSLERVTQRNAISPCHSAPSPKALNHLGLSHKEHRGRRIPNELTRRENRTKVHMNSKTSRHRHTIDSTNFTRGCQLCSTSQNRS